eukprot:CAMPEP_0171486544 /NCGR_PEP_ID=MMETSP0958-20121227/1149_1 /TAXON_ID=87120 /ORGANISM="Aurantiochytrium limacinum, Strain ATCCMYA-1381" /LENGTH=73 /DNA_ID=CAMNT_0012019435 /DNA_START=150 /DNA_END=371 /DNA_ORIENTATION=+
MLRRKPTRIELKQEDIAEFDHIKELQKMEAARAAQQDASEGEGGSKPANPPRTGRKTLRSGLSTEQRIRGTQP